MDGQGEGPLEGVALRRLPAVALVRLGEKAAERAWRSTEREALLGRIRAEAAAAGVVDWTLAVDSLVG